MTQSTFPRRYFSRLKLFPLFFLLLGVIQVNAQTADPDFWSANKEVLTIATDTTFTYIGGNFTYLGPVTGKGAKISTTSGIPDMTYPKFDSNVRAVVSDGAGGWFIGGDFMQVGSVARNRLAHVLADGTVDPVWNPGADGTVHAMVISGTAIYVAGGFVNIGGQHRTYLAKLSTTGAGAADVTWNPNPNLSVYALAVSGSAVFAGGYFTSIGGQQRNRIAKLSSSGTGAADATWNPGANSLVTAILPNGSDLFVGGHFTNIGGQARNYIAKISGSGAGAVNATWNPNPNSLVDAIVIAGSDIIVSGGFFNIGGQSRDFIARLSGTGTGAADPLWNPHPNGRVYALAIDGSHVYIGGHFTEISTQPRSHIARLSTTGTGAPDPAWNPGTGDVVYTIAVGGSNVYAGGKFNLAGGQMRKYIARFYNASGALDYTWDPNPNSYVRKILVDGSDVYVGGSFVVIGGYYRPYLAKLSNTGVGLPNSAWQPAAGGIVNAMTISGTSLYIGGSFLTVGGQARTRLAKLSTTGNGAVDATWNPGSNGDILTMAASGGYIYIGGSFSIAGGDYRDNIARLASTGNGFADSYWTSQTFARVNTVVPNGPDIYEGGAFIIAGGENRNYIAKVKSTGTGAADAIWNPDADGEVNAIHIHGSDVYVGGSFTQIGGASRNRIAKLSTSGAGDADIDWNVSLDGPALALASTGTHLYVGGAFKQTGGQLRYNLARFALPGVHTWTGAIDSNWNTAGNWNPAGVPTSAGTVLIPSGTPYAPTFSNVNDTLANFQIHNGQSLDLSAGSLSVTGSFINNGTISGAGKIVLNGAAAQTIEGAGSISNLELNNSAGGAIGTTVSDSLKLTGLLTLTSGTLTTNDKLILKSTSPSATAMVGPIPAGSGVSGNVIHERFLSTPANGSGGRSWRLLTSPLKGNGNNMIWDQWQNAGVTDGTGIDVFGPTGTGSAGNGVTPGGQASSLRTYNSSTNAYSTVGNTKTEPLFDANGNRAFLAFTSGPYGANNISSGAAVTNSDATGALNTGTQSYSFTPQNATNIYSLLGNPYACPIDFDAVYNNAGTQNINRTFWVIDPNLGNIGAYATVTFTGGSYIASAGNQNQYIQTGQGFFVEGNSIGNLSVVSIEEDDKETSAAQTAVFRTNGGSLETFRMKLYKQINNTQTLLDGAVVASHQNSSNAVDGEDGGKFGNFNESISIYKGNNIFLAVEGRQLLDDGDTVRVGLGNMQQTTYHLELEPGNMSIPGLTAVLYDNFLNTSVPVMLTGNTSYSFTVTSNPTSSGNNRFVIAFTNATPLSVQFISVNAEKLHAEVAVEWSVAEQTGTTHYEVERSADGRTFAKIGSTAINNSGNYSYMDRAPLVGNNYYRIKAIARSSRGIYSGVVRVSMNSNAAEITSYPNPVTGGSVQLHLSNLDKGTYYIQIYNNSGQQVATRQVNHGGGSSVVTMNTSNLASGIYHVKLVDETGAVISEQKIICQ